MLRETAALPQPAEWGEGPFLCVNPLKPRHARADFAVTKLRNLVFECDKLPLDRQLYILKSCGIEWSVITFSGNKSYHAILSLDKPLRNSDEYRLLHKLIANKLDSLGYQTDRACCNPSRLTRLPGGVNHSANHAPQRILYVGERVLLSDILSWLCLEKLELPKERQQCYLGNRDVPPWIKDLVQYGALCVSCSRRQSILAAACKLLENGFSAAEVRVMLARCNGFFKTEECLGDVVAVKVAEASRIVSKGRKHG
jgi:hypothetical protein